MGIQINGNTDTIAAIDGALNVSGASFGSASASSLNISGIVTTTTLSVTNIKHPSFGNNTFVLDSSGNINIDSGGVYYDATNNRLAIGTTIPSAIFHTKITTDRNLLFNTSLGGDARITALNDANSANVNFVLQGDNVILQTGGGAARVDSSGRLLVGTTSSITNGVDTKLEIIQSNAGSSAWVLIGSADTAPVSGDGIGLLRFYGKAGGTWEEAARIEARYDAAPGSGDKPSRLVFSTTSDSASSPTERLRIDNAGRILVNSASSSGVDKMHIQLTDNNGLDGVKISGNTYNTSASGTYALRIGQNIDNNGSNSAALRIDHTNPFGATGGALIQAFGNLGAAAQRIWQVNGNGAQTINRPDADGTLVAFEQAQVAEGSISVSGTTVSYNGAHLSRWSQIPDIDPHDKTDRPEILRGTVMSNLDEMCDWIDPESGEAQENEQLNKTKISDVEGDKNVAGIFQSWDDDDDTWVNDYYLAMTGDFVIRIAADVTVQRGDLLMSAGDGTAKPQDDDIIRSKTIAKVTSTNVSCTYPDGSYCVPCVLMAC